MLKYAKIIENAGGKTAVMNLFGHVGNDINGDYFASDLKYLADNKDNNGVISCKININSVGGSVFQIYSILANIDYMKEKGILVDTSCVGVAFSAAAILLASGNNRTSYDYGNGMIHDPFFAGRKDEEKNELLEKMTESLRSILVSNTNMDEETVRDYMQKETTFTSKEMLTNGMIDSIIKTGRRLDKNINNHYELMNACTDIYNHENRIINIKQVSMKRVTELLGLNVEANEDAIFNAVSDVLGKTRTVETLVDEKTVLTSKVSSLENEVRTLKSEAVKKDATILVENAVKDGKIKGDAKNVWIENAMQNFNGTKALLEGLNVTPQKINNSLNTGTTGNGELAKKYSEMLNTPEIFDTLPKEEVQKMEEAYFGSIRVESEKIN